MKYLLILFLSFSSVYGQTLLPKGTVIGIEPNGSRTRIGDSAWHYAGKGWDYQWVVLKSTKKYPRGVWTNSGPIIHNVNNCNPRSIGFRRERLTKRDIDSLLNLSR